MTDNTFSEMLTRIYAAFGKAAPSETSPVYTFLFKRVAFIENAYCDGIAAAIEGYEKAPTNVGLAILNEYNKLKPFTAKKKDCPHCYRNSGAVFFVHPTYSAPNGYVANCPHCNGGSETEIMSQLKLGAKIVPSERDVFDYWEESFGKWMPPSERAKQQQQDGQSADTPTDKTPIAEHFKSTAQLVDNFTDSPDDFWAEA